MEALPYGNVENILGYKLLEKVGEGGMGTVWRAEHEILGKSVAVKVLAPELAQDQNIVKRFINEARIEVKLRHPNVVSVENVALTPPAIVMEYVDGRDLSNLIGREVGPIPLSRAVPLMRQIVDAVEHAHDNGIVHRDIKPSNVLVADDGAGGWSVKMMDFGIARVLGAARMTRTGAAMGTAAYMSPEQIRGAQEADERSDIYSLAVTFYEILAGRTPFEEDPITTSDFELRLAHVQREPPDPRTFFPQIPEGVVQVVMQGLAKDRELRFQTVAAFRRALAGAASAVGVPWGESIAAPRVANPLGEVQAPMAHEPSVAAPAQEAPVQKTASRSPRQASSSDGVMLPALFAMLLCFPPLGVVAVVHAVKVRKHHEAGDEELAKDAASRSQRWSFSSFVVGTVVWLTVIVSALSC